MSQKGHIDGIRLRVLGHRGKILILVVLFLAGSACFTGLSAQGKPSLQGQQQQSKPSQQEQQQQSKPSQQEQQQQSKPSQQWLDQKYSMFIHFGLYSVYGGVYDGKPVTSGYSEQIQSFAGISSDGYSVTATRFNPVNWDPDAVVALAKRAGMRSIVFTAKHHDGFCLYHSLHTGFNIVDATPYGRDLLKELAEACERGGLGFGVYFSLIDWHFPQAYPISGHNADPLTPEHYRFNLAQVEELMTRYGTISEIWFDMGSLTPEQSRGLYALVNRLQPGCMVSGRLGNDAGDFCVMADNDCPGYQLAVPWQTAASAFRETWGYRSWQERGALQPKVEEKIGSLVQVIGRGGNYLLNIGPRGDGSLVEFEQALLEGVGDWVKVNAEAIYGTRANPFGQIFSWGEVTARKDTLYLFVKRDYAGRQIELPLVEGVVSNVNVLASGQEVSFWPAGHEEEKRSAGNEEKIQPAWDKEKRSAGKGNRGLSINMPEQFSSCHEVLRVTFRNGFKVIPFRVVRDNILTARNAMPRYGYSSLNYYAGYKSLIAYHWAFTSEKREINPEILFTENEKGKTLCIEIDGTTQEITLDSPLCRTETSGINTVITETNSAIPAANKVTQETSSVTWGNLYRKPGRGVFGFLEEETAGALAVAGAAASAETGAEAGSVAEAGTGAAAGLIDPGQGWEQVAGFAYGKKHLIPLGQRKSVVFMQEILSDREQTVAVEIGSGNAVYMLLNGEYLTAHFSPERVSYQTEMVLLPLQKGNNQLVIKYYNGFESELHFSITPLEEWKIYSQKLSPVTLSTEGIHSLSIRESNPVSITAPLRMHNVQIKCL
ncbi:MAG TPA: alpha-L-fucosidase [Bacteroidales bacterium]|nr:alpha-L-fucosidase [Bacteroidales bacterium]